MSGEFTSGYLQEVTGDMDGPACTVCGAIMVLGSEVTATHIVFNNHWKCLSCGTEAKLMSAVDEGEK